MISGTKVITHFDLKTKEIDYNTLTEHAIVSYDTLSKNDKACAVEQ